MLCKWFKRLFKPKASPMSKSVELVLIVGHNKKKRGAKAVEPINMYEYDYNSMFSKDIVAEAEIEGVSCAVIYRDNIGIKGAYNKALDLGPDAIIELHFNAYNGAVNGCEVLFNDRNDVSGIREKVFATLLQNNIHSVLLNNSRGVKNLSRGQSGHYNLTRLNNVPCVILEPFFGDNKWDAENFDLKKKEVARQIVKSFLEFRTIY